MNFFDRHPVLSTVLVLLVVFAMAVPVMVYGFGIEMFGLGLQKHVENKRTEVTRETNQFVTTQQQLLTTYAKEYQKAKDEGNEAQKKLIAEQIDQVAQTLDPKYVKPSINAILAAEGYDVR